LKGWRGGGEEGKRKERKGREEQGGEGFATMDRPRSRNRAAIAKGVAVASLEQREAAGPDPDVVPAKLSNGLLFTEIIHREMFKSLLDLYDSQIVALS